MFEHRFHFLLPLSFLLLVGCPNNQSEQASPPPSPPASEGPRAAAESTAAAPAAKVHFVSPKNGEKLKSPVKVVMGVEGMQVKAAGEMTENTGHHHIIVDKGAIPKGTVVPMDEQHIHFGKGQSETEIKLSPGKHSLTLQFANGAHQSYGPEMSETIEIEIEP